MGFNTMPIVEVSRVRALADRVLELANVPHYHREIQVDLLIEAELRGVPSHGLLRLNRIVERIKNGVVDPNTIGSYTWRGPGFLAVDGRRGLGPVVASTALEALKTRARKNGVAIAAIRNSNHIGMLGWYAERVAEAGFTIIALSTSEALVHPWGARKAMIGTNPIAIGLPTGGVPFMMDTATSVVSMGEIHDRANRGKEIPLDWALDENGNPTSDPGAAKTGAIAPFGQAKGYALGLAFELIVSSLSKAAIGREVRGTLDDVNVCNKGDLFIVIDGPRRDLQAYLEEIRNLPPADGFANVLIPGERGRACREHRLKQGIPLAEEVWNFLQTHASPDQSLVN
jgi:L-2-hydroxycarboxylate dehydrogenase (NAD+)